MAASRPGSGRTALFILAPPGGGAAALAAALRACGAAEVADPGAVAAFNDRRLAARGAPRTDVLGPRRRPDGDAAPTDDEVAEAAGLLRTAEPDEPLLVLGDPACTRLHALWTAALEGAAWRVGHVVLLRAPQDVAAQLSADEGLTRNGGLLLWTSYMLEAERAARGARRVTVAYDRLLADPESELDRIEGALGLRLPRRTWDSAAEVEVALRHAPRATPAPALPDALAPVRAFAEHLGAAARDEPGNADVPTQTARWFTALADLMAPVLRRSAPDPATPAPTSAGDTEALKRARAEAREAAERGEAAEARVVVLQSALAVARRRSAEAEALLQARATEASAGERDARGALAAALSARDGEREAAQRALEEAERARDEGRRAIEEERRRLEEVEARLADSETRLRGALGLLGELEAEIEDERGRHTDARDRLALLGLSNHAAQTRVRELQGQIDAARDELERRRRWLPRLFGLR